MKRLIFCFISFVLFLSSSSLFSQTNTLNDIIINPFWDFYTPNYLSAGNSGKGNTGVASEGDLLSTSLNPASFHPDKKYSAEISYGLKTNTNYFPGLDVLTLKNSFPASNISIGYKFNENFSIGFRYSNDANYKLDLGEMYVTNEIGQITGSGMAYENFNTHSFSMLLVYSGKYFNAGVNLNFVIFHSNFHAVISSEINPEGYWGDVSSNSTKFIPDFGVILKPAKNLSFGFTFSPRVEFDVTRDYPESVTTKSFVPMKISAGAACKLLDNKLSIEADYRYENTSKSLDIPVTNQTIFLKDRNNFNIGAEYLVNKYLNLRAGFFTLFDNRNVDTNTAIPKDLFDQYYLTAGGSCKIYNFTFDIAILSSEIISDKKVGHTNFILGIKYAFDKF